MWLATVDLPACADGRRRRKTVSSKDYATAAKKLRALRREVEDHGDLLAEIPTVGQWMTHWLDEIAPERVRPRTLEGYRSYVRLYIDPAMGGRRLDTLRTEHVRKMLRTMEDAGLSEATRRQTFAILSRALKVATRERKVRENVCALMDPPKVPTNHRAPFTLDEALRILAYLDVKRDAREAARWQLALLEGLRQGEALGLRWQDVDLERGCLRIEQAAQRRKGAGMVLVPPKSATSRRAIPLLGPVALALASMTGPRDGLVFPAAGGGPVDPRRDWAEWKDMLEAAGVPDRPLHAARSTTASLLNAADVPDKTVSEILGHAQVQVTHGYIQGSEERHVRAFSALSRLLAGE